MSARLTCSEISDAYVGAADPLRLVPRAERIPKRFVRALLFVTTTPMRVDSVPAVDSSRLGRRAGHQPADSFTPKLDRAAPAEF